MTIFWELFNLRCATACSLLAILFWSGSDVSASAACISDAAAEQKSVEFIANPNSLIRGTEGPRSSDDVINDVQNFVTANPQALTAVINVLRELTKQGTDTSVFQKAIGTGLGKAAKLCQVPDLTFANEIQTQLAGVASTDANSQYAAITGTDPTRSVAAGGLGAGSTGGVGGSTGQSASSSNGAAGFQTFVANSVSNSSPNYFGASVGGAGGVSLSSTTTILCTVSSSC